MPRLDPPTRRPMTQSPRPMASRSRPTVYVETSVVSYLTARASRDVVVAGRQAVTREWWARAPRRFHLVHSSVFVEEARGGDPVAAAARLAALDAVTLLPVTGDATRVVRTLLAENAVPRQAEPDAYHIAIAAANQVDVL